MAVSSVARELEALIDLFLSPSFDPFEPESPIETDCEEASRPETEIIYEADTDDDSVHAAAYTRQCGRVLAELGDKFYSSHTEPKTSSTDHPWFGVGEKLKAVFNEVTEARVKGSNFEEEKRKAWSQFKGIMSTAISDTPVADVYKQLGAVLLTLHGLSNLASGTRGLARQFFIRYIRDRKLDAQIQQLGGLEPLIHPEVD